MSNVAAIKRVKFNVDGLRVSQPMIQVAQHLVLTGSVKTAAEIVDVNYNTVNTWLAQNEDFQKLVQQFTDAMLMELRTELVGVSREALEVIRTIMLDDTVDPAQRLKAAQDLLGRAGLNAEKKQQVDINNNYNIFAQMPDDELDKIINIDFNEDVIDVESSKDGADSNSKDGEVKEDIVE